MNKALKTSDCPYFKPLATNPDVCAKWVRPVVGPDWMPFCLVEQKCPTLGLRLATRADQERDSEE